MTINIIILSLLLLAALWTAMARSLLRSAIGLALTSAILTLQMFRLNAPLAAIFELSVCSGLISVIFITVISLTQPLSWPEIIQHARRRLQRFWLLPLLLLLVGGAVYLFKSNLPVHLPLAEPLQSASVELWSSRQLDLLGQIAVLLAGAFGVLILFKEK